MLLGLIFNGDLVRGARSFGPLLADEWLASGPLRSGFSGAEVCFRDFQNHRHNMSVIISTDPETMAYLYREAADFNHG